MSVRTFHHWVMIPGNFIHPGMAAAAAGRGKPYVITSAVTAGQRTVCLHP